MQPGPADAPPRPSPHHGPGAAPPTPAPPPAADPDATVVRPAVGGVRAPPAGPVVDPDATVVRPPAAWRSPRPPRAPDADATVVVPLRRPAGGPAGQAPTRPWPPTQPTQPTLPLGPPGGLPTAVPVALPPGTTLHEYRLEAVLGQGGFGITYLATDVHLHARVAIKEYLPEEIAFRTAAGDVGPNATRHRERYEQGLRSFVHEARTLASLQHPAIVRVLRYFEARHTAYMVLAYEAGQSFKRWWPGARGLGEAGLVERLLPLFDGLESVHAAGFLHRDIKPDNLQVREEGSRFVLLDFGSAAQAVAVAEAGAVVLTPGYAPPEQYGLGSQGPWTDVYALAATLYWAVTGRKPPDAEQRLQDPASLVPAAQAASGGPWGAAFLAAIDAGLALDPAQRPRDMASFRRLLCADHMAALRLEDALQQGDSGLDTVTGAPDPARAAARRPRWRRALRRWRPRDWPLALTLPLLLLCSALLPMLATGLVNLRGALDAVRQAELHNVEQLAWGGAARLGEFVAGGERLSRLLALDPQVQTLLQPAAAAPLAGARAADAEALRQRLQRVVAGDPGLHRVLVLNRRGEVVLSTTGQQELPGLDQRRFFLEGLAGRGFTAVLDLDVGGDTGLFCAQPVLGPDGAVLGVLALRLQGAPVVRTLQSTVAGTRLTPLLLDADGVLVYHPDTALRFATLLPLPDARAQQLLREQRFGSRPLRSLNEQALATAVRAAPRGHVGFHSPTTGGEEMAGFAAVPGQPWTVVLSESRQAFEAPLRRLYQQLWWSLAGVGLLASVLGVVLARRLLRPVQALTAAAGALKRGDFDAATVAPGGHNELGRLGRTFNVMVKVLRQRRAASDAGPAP